MSIDLVPLMVPLMVCHNMVALGGYVDESMACYYDCVMDAVMVMLAR